MQAKNIKGIKFSILLLSIFLNHNLAYPQNNPTTDPRLVKLNNDGVNLINQNQFLQAIKVLEQALAINPNYSKAKENLAIAYNNYGLTLSNKDPKGALKQFEQAAYLAPNVSQTVNNLNGIISSLGLNPNSFKDRVKLANDARMAGNFNGAIVEYLAALNIHDDRDIRIKLGDVYRVNNQNKDAITQFKLAVIMKDTADVELKLGQAYQANGDLTSAIGCYSKAIALKPDDSDVVDSLVAGWEDALKQDPTAPANHIGLGQALQFQGDFGQAQAEYQTAISFSPNHQNPLASKLLAALPEAKKQFQIDRYINSGVDLQTRKHYAEAIAEYQKALNLDKNNAAVLINIGSAYQAQGDNQNAVNYYTQALAIAPNNQSANEGLKQAKEALAQQKIDDTAKAADDLFKAGKYDEAIAKYQELINNDPKDAATYFDIGAAYQAKGDLNNAIVNYRQAVDLADSKTAPTYQKALNKALAKSADPIIQQGIKRQQEKDYVGAETFYQQAITLTPDNAALWFDMATAQYADQDYASSRLSFKKALELDPKGQADDLYLIATIEENNGNGSSALSTYRNYVTTDPNGQYVSQAKDRIKALTKDINNTIKIKSPEELENIKKANDDYTKAVTFQQNQQYDKALPLYQEAIKLQPKEASYEYALGTLYQQQNDLDNALTAYQQALTLDPKNADYQKAISNVNELKAGPIIQKAIEKQTSGDLDTAINLYNQAIAIIPNNAELWTNLASAYQQSDHFNEAINAYKKGYDLDHKASVDNLYFLGVLDENAQNGRQAINHYNDYIKASPNGQYVTQAKSRIAALTANINACIKIPTRNQIKTAQESSKAYDDAVKLQQAGKFDEALAAYQKAISLSPNEAAYAYGLGTLYQEHNDMTNAIIWYSKAHELDPKNQTYANIVATAQQSKQSSEAMQAYNDAVKLQTDQKYDDAIAQYLKAISISPSEASFYYSLGTCYQAKNDLDNALKYYTKAATLNPKEPAYTQIIKQVKEAMAAPYLESAYKKQTTKDASGNYDIAGAINDYEKALKLDDSATTHLNLGTAYQALNNNVKAISEYEKAISLDKNQSDAYYYLGTVYDTLNRPNQALTNYEKYAKMAPSGANIESAKQRIAALRKTVVKRRR